MSGSDETPLTKARHQLIAERAYGYWDQRGRPIDSPEVDWLRAESEIDREAPWSSDRRAIPRAKRSKREPPGRAI